MADLDRASRKTMVIDAPHADCERCTRISAHGSGVTLYCEDCPVPNGRLLPDFDRADPFVEQGGDR